jgi:hypothetical protein
MRRRPGKIEGKLDRVAIAAMDEVEAGSAVDAIEARFGVDRPHPRSDLRDRINVRRSPGRSRHRSVCRAFCPEPSDHDDVHALQLRIDRVHRPEAFALRSAPQQLSHSRELKGGLEADLPAVARFAALPSPSHHQNKMSLPCCVRIARNPGATSGRRCA